MTGILVIGKSGQVAQALALVGGEDVTCLGRSEADLLDPQSLRQALDMHRPSAVINTGAFTHVDGAESEPEAAYALNVRGTADLATACAVRNVPLIHLSTDCVFDGAKAAPYTPQDATNPLGVYGRTKLEGEQAVLGRAPASLVVRVTWIFSQFGRNFVRTMLELAKTRPSVRVVRDQYGCPTFAPALAHGLLDMARQIAAPGFASWGIYHLAGHGSVSRADMAIKIFELSGQYGGPVAEVIPVATADYPTPAQRPLNARLDMSDTTRVFGVAPPEWAPGLEQTVDALIKELSA